MAHRTAGSGDDRHRRRNFAEAANTARRVGRQWVGRASVGRSAARRRSAPRNGALVLARRGRRCLVVAPAARRVRAGPPGVRVGSARTRPCGRRTRRGVSGLLRRCGRRADGGRRCSRRAGRGRCALDGGTARVRARVRLPRRRQGAVSDRPGLRYRRRCLRPFLAARRCRRARLVRAAAAVVRTRRHPQPTRRPLGVHALVRGPEPNGGRMATSAAPGAVRVSAHAARIVRAARRLRSARLRVRDPGPGRAGRGLAGRPAAVPSAGRDARRTSGRPSCTRRFLAATTCSSTGPTK